MSLESEYDKPVRDEIELCSRCKSHLVWHPQPGLDKCYHCGSESPGITYRRPA